MKATTLNVRFESNQMRALQKLAGTRGVTVSEVVRDLVLREIGKVFASEDRDETTRDC